MQQPYDVIIQNGLFFDGRQSPKAVRHLGICQDRLTTVSDTPLAPAPHTRVIDATACWVTPGFIDCHTHYDAEVELAPGLDESLRHGVTTVLLGSCSLSLAVGTPEDLADMFCRVEALPYDVVRNLLEERKTWSSHGDYLAHLDGLPLGPHVASFVGHSAIRAHVMGLERSLQRAQAPTEAELQAMEALLCEGLDLGYLGASIQTLPWDKMGGTRSFRSRPLPSCFARWSEYRRLTRILRERGRIFQGVPNVSTKWNVILFLLESMGLWRKTLKTTIISMMDTRATRGLHHVIGGLSRLFNRVLGADFRWQALPELFDLWADGIDLVVFEEFGAGTAALHLQEAAARAKLLREPSYRQWFRRQWQSWLLPKVFHRNFEYSTILACPDPCWVGKSFTEVARIQRGSAVDTFLDLVAEHGDRLRWYTIMANDRPGPLQYIVSHPDVLIGFSDAGAHLRQMAHYNFPLRMLKLVRDADLAGKSFMSIERAVHRLTAEIGDWLGLDAGTLAPGKRADVVVIDPTGLDDTLEQAVEAPIPCMGGFVRLVRRNERAVRAVLVAGKPALLDGQLVPALGQERGFGHVLRAAT